MASILANYCVEYSGELMLVFGAVFITANFLYRRHNVTYSRRKLPNLSVAVPSLPFLLTKMKDIAEFCVVSPGIKLGEIFCYLLGSK